MTTLNANSVEPFYNVHPGELIKSELEFRGLSQRKLAKEMGVSYSQFNEMLNGKRALNSEMALLIEAALGLDAQPLMRMQMDYNLRQAREDKSIIERLANIRRIAVVL